MNNRYKYPRAPHLPWSPGVTHDDVRSVNTAMFEGKDIVITEKMDGENTTLYRDHIHARSIDSRHHVSRDWVKQFHARIAHDIPAGWRVCGENLYAQHSITYTELQSYFYGFSIWNDENRCLNWKETQEWFDLLDITAPPVLYQGGWDESLIRTIHVDTNNREGYVIRTSESFTFKQFPQHIAKWVRHNHVQTDEHWMFAPTIPNQLIGEDSE